MSIAATVIGLATTWLKGNGERKRREHEQVIAEIKNGLRDTDKLLRRGSFFLLSFPLIWAYFDPSAVADYFVTVKVSMPGWYIEAYLTIVFSIWGISTVKNVILGAIRTWRRK